ncbi:MAG: hypothetical protein ING50_11500 [Burkholderiales bacterium]|nr:hypothetical protein [Burkholderiales bacterium]
MAAIARNAFLKDSPTIRPDAFGTPSVILFFGAALFRSQTTSAPMVKARALNKSDTQLQPGA